jgi:hypothetical protein
MDLTPTKLYQSVTIMSGGRKFDCAEMAMRNYGIEDKQAGRAGARHSSRAAAHTERLMECITGKQG